MAVLEMRRLTPEEKIVLKAIIAQRGNSWGDIFTYDIKAAQEYFVKTGVFAKYKLDFRRHSDIMEQLADDCIIDTDCIMNVDFLNNYRQVCEPNLPHIESDKKFFWARNKDWAHNTCSLNGRLSIEEYAKNQTGILIRMSTDEANYLDDNCNARHTVTLALDEEWPCLSIKIDQEEWKKLRFLHKDKDPFRILQYAYRNRNRSVTQDELTKHGMNSDGRYLKSQVFSDNKTVQALCPLLLKLDEDSIMFVATPVKVTLTELDELKTALGII